MDFLNAIGFIHTGLGKASFRLEFPFNVEMFQYLDTNRQLQQFVRPPNSKNPKDPDSQTRLQTLTLKAKNEAEKTDTLPDQDTGVKLVPLDQIFTDHKNFQNRESEFSQESVTRILNAIQDGSFSWAAFDPIILWVNPSDQKFYVLSGHSRNEAFRQAEKLGLTMAGKDFTKIPAKLFEGSLKEAKELARISNNLSTKETEIERAIFYREKRNDGLSPKEIKEMAQKYEGKNANFILNLSYLNPAGKAWESLKLLSSGTESENSRTIKEIADWIGDARRKINDLTNLHENEIFDWLFSGAFQKLKTKRNFLERLGMAISKATQFGIMDERLNIENRSGKSETELEYDEKVQAARLEYLQGEKELREKRKEFIARGAEPEKLDSYLQDYQARVNNSLRRLNELVKLRDQVKEGAKNQLALFGLSGQKLEFDFLGAIGAVSAGIGTIDLPNDFQSNDLYFSNEDLDLMNKYKITKSEILDIYTGVVPVFAKNLGLKTSQYSILFVGMTKKGRFIGFIAEMVEQTMFRGKSSSFDYKIVISVVFPLDISQIAAIIKMLK
jgi:hypothetical protein